MSSSNRSVEDEIQSLRADLPKEIQSALNKPGNDPALILEWLSLNKKDLSELFEGKNDFTDVFSAFSEDTKKLFQQIHFFCCNAFWGTGNVILQQKKRELVNRFYSLDKKIIRDFASNKDAAKLLPFWDEIRLLVKSIENAPKQAAISEKCLDFLNRVKLLPTRSTAGKQACRLHTFAVEQKPDRNAASRVAARRIAGVLENLSDETPIRDSFIAKTINYIISSRDCAAELVSLVDLENILHIPVTIWNLPIQLSILWQQKGRLFDLSKVKNERVLMNAEFVASVEAFLQAVKSGEISKYNTAYNDIVHASYVLFMKVPEYFENPKMSLEELITKLEANHKHRDIVPAIKQLLRREFLAVEDVSTGIEASLTSGSIDFDAAASKSVATSSSSDLPEVISTFTPRPDTSLFLGPTPFSINSKPSDYHDANDSSDDTRLTPPLSDSELIDLHFNEDDNGKDEDKGYLPQPDFGEKKEDGVWAYDRDDYETGVKGAAGSGKTEVIPSIFSSSFDDVSFGEAERLFVDSEKEVPSVDADETSSDPTKPLLSPNPAAHEFGWEDFILNAAKELLPSMGSGAPKKTDPAKKQLETSETTKKSSGEKESSADLTFPKENKKPNEKGEKKEPSAKGESKKTSSKRISVIETIKPFSREPIGDPLTDHEEREGEVPQITRDLEQRGDNKKNNEAKTTAAKKEGAGQGHTAEREHLEKEALGVVTDGEISESEEDALNYFMQPGNQPLEDSHRPGRRRDGRNNGLVNQFIGDEFDPFNLLSKRTRNDADDAVDEALFRVGELFPIDEDEFSVLDGVAAPAIITSTASALPPGSSTTHLITGLPPFYYALRDLYKLLQKPQGFKHLSIPRMKMYLEKLKEIKSNAALTVAGSVLWDTLNPPPPSDFRAEQLLEVLADGKNILDEAIEKHQIQYFEPIRKELTKSTAKKYWPIGKCFYIENIGGVTYLMLRDGANPSDEELKEAIREYQVVCEDMCNKTDAKAYLLDDPFTRNKENQEKIATIMTRFGMELANDNTVQESNKAVHKAVHELSKKMKDPVPETAGDIKEEKDWTEELRLNYRVMSSSEHCLIPDGTDAKEPERVRYLDDIEQWEKKPEWSYLNSVSILNDVLPELKPDTYKKEKVLAQVYPLPMDGLLESEVKRRTAQRELHYKHEMQLQETIKHSLQTAAAEVDDATWLEQDCNAAKTEAEAFTKTVRVYKDSEEPVEDCGEADLALAIQESIITYEAEQCERLEQKHQFVFHDVRGDGNCFYRAVADQMKQQGICKFNQNGIELHVSLRQLVQGRDFANGEWAGVKQLFKLVKETNTVIAVVDTRYPELGFRCYFRNNCGNIAETYYPSEFATEAIDRTIIRLAYTGNHYMSVREHNTLTTGALRTKFDIAECLQSRPAVSLPQQIPVAPAPQSQRQHEEYVIPASQHPIQSQKQSASEQLRQSQRRANTRSERPLPSKDKKSSVPVVENLDHISNTVNLSQFGIFHHQSSPPSTVTLRAPISEKKTSEKIESSVPPWIPVH